MAIGGAVSQTAVEAWDKRWATSEGRADWLEPHPAVVAIPPELHARGARRVLDLGCGVGRVVALVAEQVFATDQLQEARPMLGVGAARQHVNVVVRPAALARIGPGWRIGCGRPPRRRFAGARLRHEHSAAVMHNRILHCHLQPAPLPGAHALVEGADNTESEQHTGASVANRTAWFDRPAARLAGNAHRTSGCLRNRIEG